MTAESKRLHDKLMPPGHYESVLERETASWFECTTYADAGLPTEVKVRSIEDMKQELKDALAFIDFNPRDPNRCDAWAWVPLATAMVPHSREGEDLNRTAAKIVAAAYRELLAKIETTEKP